MKKIFLGCFILMFIFSLGFIPNICNKVYAQTEPYYDKNFNNGIGAFFANGNPITISDIDGKTTITWNTGKEEVTNTTLVFGGGQANSSFDSASITLESGTVGSIYSGGFSTSATEPAIVDKATITINGGTVNSSILGGGLLYTTVNNSNIIVNDGTATFVLGGGIASYTYNKIPYNTGTKEAPQDSGTIVKAANITINNGSIEDLYGGGQGYSNTESTSVNINGGTFKYVTAGGSNGYTGIADVNINGGDINIYLSTNRGTVDTVNLKMTNGNVKDLYIGGEDAFDVTGILNKIKANLSGGKVTNLYAGLNGGVPFKVSPPNYLVSYSPGVVENNYIPDLININTLLITIIPISVVLLIAIIALAVRNDNLLV